MKMVTPAGHGPNLETVQTHVDSEGVLVRAICVCDCEFWSQKIYFAELASTCQVTDWTVTRTT